MIIKKSSNPQTVWLLQPDVAPLLCALIVILLATSVLVGWQFNISHLKSIFPGYITMKVNTAIGLIALAIAMFLINKEPVARWKGLVALFLGAGVIAISVCTLFEYLNLFHLRIDEILFKDSDGEAGLFPPGRLAPITAVNFILLSLAIVFSENRIRRFLLISQILEIIVFLTAFQAFAGYALGLTYLFGSAFYTQMALHTSAAFILLSVGSLLARPSEGVMEFVGSNSVSGQVARKLILACICIPLFVKFVQERGEKAGLFDSDFGILIQVMGNTVFLAAIVWKTAAELFRTDSTAKKASMEFYNIQAQLDLIANSLPALVSYCDMSETYLFANSAYSVWFKESSNPIGKKVRDFLDEQAYRAAVPHILEVLNGKSVEYETEWVLKSGDKSVKVNYTPHFDSANIQRGFVILVNDITDLKNAIKARDRFLSLASHELKTPITSLKLQNEIRTRKILRSTPPSPLQPEDALKMFSGDREKIDRLAAHIETMLDISKINADRFPLKTTEFDVALLLEDVIQELDPHFEISHTSVKTQLLPGVMIQGDRDRVKQVFLNLLINAVKYGSGKPVSLLMENLRDTISITIKDEGIGISKIDHQRIFQRFERAVSDQQPSGLGLGLFLAKDIVDRHGGKISVESEPGLGSAFKVQLPRQFPSAV